MLKVLGIDMVEWTALATFISIVATFVFWLFKNMVVQRLQDDIKSLTVTVDRLSDLIEKEQQQRSLLEKQVDNHEYRITTLEKKGGEEHDQSN